MSILRTLFLSSPERRLRAGWRLLLQTVLLIGISSGIGLVIRHTLRWPPGMSFLLAESIELLSVTSSVYIARRWLDRRSFVSLGLRPTPRAQSNGNRGKLD